MLRIASLECGDMSGFAYVAKVCDAARVCCQGSDLLYDAMQMICQEKKLPVSGTAASTDLLAALDAAYHGSEVKKLLERFSVNKEPEVPKEPEKPKKAENPVPPKKPKPVVPKPAGPEPEEMLSGKIGKLIWIAEHGEILAADENGTETTYPFQFRDVVDKSLRSECEHGTSGQKVLFALNGTRPVQIERPESFAERYLDLSLIHISEPTRP